MAPELVQSLAQLSPDELLNYCYSVRFVPMPVWPPDPMGDCVRGAALTGEGPPSPPLQLVAYVSAVRFLVDAIDVKYRRNTPLRRACTVLLTAVMDQQDWSQQRDVAFKDPAWKEVGAHPCCTHIYLYTTTIYRPRRLCHGGGLTDDGHWARRWNCMTRHGAAGSPKTFACTRWC